MPEAKRSSSVFSWFLVRPYTSGLIFFFLLLFLSGFIVFQRYKILNNQQQLQTSYAVETAKNRLRQSLTYSVTATQALSFIIDDKGQVNNFDSAAAFIIRNNKYIDVLELVPGGVIKYIYPLKGNEPAMGYNIFEDPKRNKEAFRALKLKKLYFAGPFYLRQGGMAVIGRLPVFVHEKFWGFSAVIIHMATLMHAAGIEDGRSGGYLFQLSKINTETGKREYFLPHSFDLKSRLATTMKIEEGDWELTAFPAAHNKINNDLLRIIILAGMFSLLGTVLIIELLRSPYKLQKQVAERTKLLDESEKRNKAIVNAIPDLMFVIDKNGLITDFNNPQQYKTYNPEESFIGKNIREVLPALLATEIIQNIQEALLATAVISHEYELEYPDGLRHFEARYIKSGANEVLAIVRDISPRKISERKLQVREAMLSRAQEIGRFGSWEWRAKNDQHLWSKEMYELMGVDPSQEINSEFFFQLIHPQDRLRVRHSISDAMEITGKYAEEFRVINKDGSIKYVQALMNVYKDENERPVYAIGVAQDITGTKASEEELRRSYEEIRRLSEHLQNIREEERADIAREIHDELGQQLTVLKMDISWLNKKIPEDDAIAQERMRNLLEMINHTVKTVRKISADLRPSMLDDLGLDAALEWHAQEFEKRSGIKTNLTADIPDEKLSDKISTSLFRIFQETLTNTARHAEATEINASLYRQHENIILEIADNGKGFSVKGIENKKTLGILGMRERIKMVGGEFMIQSSPLKGTTIRVIVPVQKQTNIRQL